MFGSLPELQASLPALAIGVGVVLLLHHLIQPRAHWLVVLLLAALAFVLVSLGGEHREGQLAFEIVRWSLFVVTMGGFIRYRWSHRFTRAQSPPD